MTRKTNHATALDHAARIGVAIEEEPGGVELWGFNAHMSDGGAHIGYVNREDFATAPAMWREVSNRLGQYSECPADCECRATVPHSDGVAAEFDKYFPACKTCGQWTEACACTHECVNSPTLYNVEYSDECGNHSTVAHAGLKSVADTVSRMGGTGDTIGFNGENLTCNNVPEQWTDSEYGYEYVTVCGQYPHRSGDPERITLFTIVVTRPTPVSDTLPTCDTCGQCGTVPHSDGIAAEFDKYFPPCATCGQWSEICACMEITDCPICGDPIDYCLGHGPIDPNYLEGM